MSRLERDCYERMEYREQHIDDILSLLYPQLTKPLSECTVLDMGCGIGGLSLPAASRVKRIKGIDLNESYISICKKKASERGVRNADFEKRSIFEVEERGEYDIVLCSDVLEHVADQNRVIERIVFCLVDGGVFYLTTNNKYWPVEGHYGLLFLSYQSRERALKRIIRRNRGQVYNIYPLSYGDMKRLLAKYPVDFEFKPPRNPQKALYKFGSWLVRRSSFFWNFSNAFQVIGKKRSSSEG